MDLLEGPLCTFLEEEAVFPASLNSSCDDVLLLLCCPQGQQYLSSMSVCFFIILRFFSLFSVNINLYSQVKVKFCTFQQQVDSERNTFATALMQSLISSAGDSPRVGIAGKKLPSCERFPYTGRGCDVLRVIQT